MSKVYKFSDFILDGKSVSFYHQNNYISLSSRAFNILLYLIERRGEIVGKDEILDKVWNDSFVEEANLAVHISALRRTLQEKKGESRFIRTISGRGYSFIADVEEVESSQRINKTLSENLPPKKKISIAVLPFTIENSSDDDEYLANGITQSLIGDLSKNQDLRVLAYSAVKPYKKSDLELHEIGFLLDADKILTGSISEYKGRWEISAELIRTSDKSCLWMTTHTFKAEDIFEVKREIASAIVEKLKLKLINPLSEDKKEINYEAQKHYFRGKHIFESRASSLNFEETLRQALKFFNEAIEKEPFYALAYVGIGRVYLSFYLNYFLNRDEAYKEIQKAFQMALLTGSDLSEVYIFKGSIEFLLEFNFTEAEKSFEKAIEVSPNQPDGYYWKSHICTGSGEFEEALRLMDKVLNTDYISIIFNEHLVRVLYFYGKYESAIVVADELLEFNKNMPGMYLFKAISYAQLGLYDLAVEAVDIAIEKRNMAEFILYKAFILGLFGKEAQAREIFENVLSSFNSDAIDKYDIAGVYCVLDEKEKAFEYLYKAFENKSVNLTKLRVDPRMKSLRNDVRFDDLLGKLGLK